ncbi:MAG: hypothetical protein O6766_00905, partial [Gammaproteobacteria bacterium]|nr:hypothetical protein [Gammaproteobacteria bacterium]
MTAAAACICVLAVALVAPRWALAATAAIRSEMAEAVVSSFPVFSGFHLTQNGNRLLMLRSNGEHYDLIVKDVTDVEDGAEKIVYSASISKGLLNWCRWANNDRIVC